MSDLAGDAEKSRAAKIALRSRMLTGRRLLSTAARTEAAAKIQVHLRDLVRSVTPTTIAAYVPVGAEPGGPDLPTLLAESAHVLLPVLLDDGDLDWAHHAGTLIAGPRGLRQPPGPRLGVDAIRSADLILVPALAVDHHGRRMGRGGGSYDRALARLTSPVSLSPVPPLSGPALSGPALSGPAASGPPLSGPPLSGPPLSGPAAFGPADSGPPLSGSTAFGSVAPGSVPPGFVVALLHDGELIDEVPAEPHDRLVHGVITPTGAFALSRAFEWTK